MSGIGGHARNAAWLATELAIGLSSVPNMAASLMPGYCRLEFFPGLVAAVERRDAGDIDIAGLAAVAIVLDRLFEREAREVAVGLLDLRDLVSSRH